MDMTPSLEDSDTFHAHTPAHSIPYQPTASSSSATGQTHQQSMHDQSISQPHRQPSAQPKMSNGPHIRSRITVVCAECKRLKLKCDRRTPCSSCIKRDTVQRCVYSQAAAEKIDVQSLHNRVLQLESVIAKIHEANPSATVSSVISNLPSLKGIFASSSSGVPLSSSASLGAGMQASGCVSQGSVVGHTGTDRALLAVGTTGSSVIVNVEDVSSIWIGELEDLTHPDPPAGSSGSFSTVRVKLEPTPVLMPPPLSGSFASSMNPGGGKESQTSHFVPPIPYDTFLPENLPSTHVTVGSLFPELHGAGKIAQPPQVTAKLLAHLPAKELRPKYMRALEETMMLHPCFNVRHFAQRVDAMFAWGEAGSVSPNALSLTAASTDPGSQTKAALAREVFFGQPPPPVGKGKANAKTGAGQQHGAGNSPKPTLSFFAAACAAFALGALVCKTNSTSVVANPSQPQDSTDRPSTASSSSSPSASQAQAQAKEYEADPAALFALADQALGLFEKTSLYDLDAVIAMILQILYHLHDGQMSVAQGVFPLVGKMINVARMMGLAIDPDEFPGTYNLFEAETRRRIWWDVFYYDLFISDCMGHLPLIPDNSFTTRMPADVDEEQFTPSSLSLPTASTGEGAEKGTAYFPLKCRLAQLVKNVKKHTFRDPLSEDPAELSLDQAAAFETDVQTFLAELPPAFRLELGHDWSQPWAPSPGVPPFLQAQKCELAILANRLILKLYLPFLKEGTSAGKSCSQAVLGTINAAHLIIYASRMLHVVWRSTRPAAFDFYDFGRTLFDAAVMCAHAVIQQPTTLLAMEAMKSVSSALEVMKELGASRVGVEGVRGEGNRSDAIRIVEMMKRKAENARGYGVGSTFAGTKRKREPLDDDRMYSGFHLPFVGASVSSVKADPPRSSPSKSLGGFAKDMSTLDGRPKGDIKKLARDKEKDKDKAAKPAPIRARPSGTPSTSRPRTASVSSNAPSIAASIRRMESATPGLVTAPPAAQSQPLPPPPPLPSASPRIAAYDAYSSLPPQTPVHEHMQQEEYPMQYNSGDDSSMDRRRFSSQSFGDSPQGAPMYDQAMREASLSHPSPASASYSTGPATPHYYQYAPPPGPPPAGPQPGYDSTTVGHHNVPPMAALTHPAHVEQQQQGGAPVPMTSMTDSQYMSYEKTHPAPPYGPHVRATDQTRPLAQAHDYQQAHPHPHQLHIPGSQTWLQPDPNAHTELWGDYKYMS